MSASSRREFLTDVGRGMLTAGLGASLASDLGFSPAFAEQGADSLTFGPYDALVDLLQQTPPEKLQSKLVAKLRNGEADLRQLIAAGALANAESFGGEDYVGFHTAMALLPALEMTRLLPSPRQPLPVLKVLLRNSLQLQEKGGASHRQLELLHAAEHIPDESAGLAIREAVRQADMDRAEALFAAAAGGSIEHSFDVLQPSVQDDMNIHRFVFAHRTYGLAKLLGQSYAHTLLRQCVRFCVDHERNRLDRNQQPSPIRTVLPRLLDEYKLAGRTLGNRDPGDEAIEELSRVFYKGPSAQAAEAAAAALAEGISPEAVGEAISLTSTMIVLRQGPDKPRAHGDAAGVHSSDATNAWRNMARVDNGKHASAGLIVAAYHAPHLGTFSHEPYPTEEHRAPLKGSSPADLLAEAEDAVRHNDQGRATAAIEEYGKLSSSPEPVYNLMLKYAISEDGRLHGEKYFHTVREEFATTRPAFRWRHMVGLARVTASAYGFNRADEPGHRAPGYEEACGLLGVES
jgi:hypothetical protein